MSNLEVKATPEKITITKEGVKTSIIPTTEEGKLATKTASQISQTGIPSNKDLDDIGDKIWEFLELSKQQAPDVKTEKMVDNAQKVVGDIQQVVQEKNYDERLQEISRKLKYTKDVGDLSGLSIEMREDAERIRERLRVILPNLFSFSRAFVGDYQFRDLMATLLDVLQNSYERSQEGTPDVSEALKQDIRGTTFNEPVRGTTFNENRGTTFNEPIMITTQNEPIRNTTLNEPYKGTTYNEPIRSKDALEKKYENAKKYMNLTEDEKEKLLDKFAASLVKMRGNREYFDFVENGLKLYDELCIIWDRLQKHPELNVTYTESASIMHDIRVLIERSSNRSMDRWIELVKSLSRLREDPKFVSCRKDLEDLLFDREGKYQAKEQIKEKYRMIKNQFEELDNQYNNVFDQLSHESRELVNGIKADPLIAKLRNDFDTLFKDIFTDISGKPSANVAGDAAMKIRNVFYPIIKDKLANVNFPIIEVDSDKYQFRIEDFYLRVTDMLPDQLNIETDSSIQVDVDKMKRSGTINLRVRLDSMSADIKKIKFLLNKKTGIKYHDYGIIDIKLRDCGIYFHFKVTLESDKMDSIKLESVDSNFDGMKIKIIDSRHDVLDKIITTLFIPYLRGKVKSAVDSSLMDTINNGLCDQVNMALRSMEERR